MLKGISVHVLNERQYLRGITMCTHSVWCKNGHLKLQNHHTLDERLMDSVWGALVAMDTFDHHLTKAPIQSDRH